MNLAVAVGIVVFLIGLVCVACITMLVKAQELQQSCIGLLDCTYEWLKQIQEEQEVKTHEGTE